MVVGGAVRFKMPYYSEVLAPALEDAYPSPRLVRIPELASLQRYTALPEGARQVAEDQHIAESDYPHPAPMVKRATVHGFRERVVEWAAGMAHHFGVPVRYLDHRG